MRRKSFKILYDVFFGKALLNDVINETFKKNEISDKDKAFIKRETTGVVEKLDNIDLLINKYSKVKTKKLNNDILVVFRLAIYEMLYMDRVPAYATINEYVNIIKKSKSSKLSNYVNAILRSIERGERKDTIKESASEKNRYFRIYNSNEKNVLNELDSKNVTYSKYDGALKFNNAKVYKIDKYKSIIDTACFKNGYALIEDASSIHLTDRLAMLFSNNENVYILDVCSSPGGKVLGFIDLIKDNVKKIHAYACDISEEKVFKIGENIKRLIKNSNIDIRIKINDATIENSDFIGKFDLVICDVPCTGLGVIDKKPDIFINYSDKKRDELVKIQKKILDVSKKYLKNGGYLSYSTCTETKEENEDNVKDFLSKNTDFSMIYEKKIRRNDENKCDGFYMAIMKYEY